MQQVMKNKSEKKKEKHQMNQIIFGFFSDWPAFWIGQQKKIGIYLYMFLTVWAHISPWKA